jgi:hypothetical protein
MNPRFLRLVQLGLKWGGSDYDRVGGVERSDRRLYMEGCPNKVIVILITARLSELSLLRCFGCAQKKFIVRGSNPELLSLWALSRFNWIILENARSVYVR